MLDLIRMAQVEPVRKRLDAETQRLLGNTITLTDDQWRAPSLLPGWTRAHVATHIARNADAFARVTRNAEAGIAAPFYESYDAKVRELETGALRGGMELQVDLDTSAGGLVEAFDIVTDWHREIEFPWGPAPLSMLTVARLHEVYSHHVDLDCGFVPADFDPVPARWLMQWALLRLPAATGRPLVSIASDSGLTAELGRAGEGEEPRHVTGPDSALWAWVTGRSSGDHIAGAEGITWPLMG